MSPPWGTLVSPGQTAIYVMYPTACTDQGIGNEEIDTLYAHDGASREVWNFLTLGGMIGFVRGQGCDIGGPT